MSKKPTLELNPAASEAPQPAASEPNIVVDASGRRLKIEEPDILTESRLVRLIGQESALNSAYMGAYVVPAISVVEIDGDPMPFPMTLRELDAAIKRVGRDGLRAVVLHLAGERADVTDDAADAVKN